MKLNYNVLCIDDDIDSLKRNKAAFTKLAGNVGIEVIYKDINADSRPRETTRDAYVQRISDDIKSAFANDSYFDIILIDLHLKNNVEGHELIQYIRDNHSIYRPVIFYSAGTPETDARAREQLTKAAIDSGVFGKNILITPRRQIDVTLASIAGEMQVEEHKIPQVRGLLMDRVSELDASIVQAVKIEALWAALSDESKVKLEQYIKSNFVEGRYKDQTKVYNDLKALDLDGIKAIVFSDAKTIDTFTKVRILKEALSLIDGMNDNADVLKQFVSADGLNAIRNHYAHKTAAQLDAEHNVDKCVMIRNESRRQLKNIGTVLSKFEG